MAQAELSTLEAILGHAFVRGELLELALTHSSVPHENAAQQGSVTGATPATPQSDNEQLEFLGDAALGLLVAEALYHRFPSVAEGGLTRLRASLVSRKHLAEVAARLHLGDYLRVGRGEERSGGRRKPAILANALEAVFAAIYLDGGLEALRRAVATHVVEPSVSALESGLDHSNPMGDHKSALQERLQASGAGQPKYVTTQETGPDHKKSFTVAVRLLRAEAASLDDAPTLATASGPTKKQAQQEAARLAYQNLNATSSGLDSAVPSPTLAPV